LRSVPLEAAVGDVLAFLSVEVAITRTRSRVSPNSRATSSAMRARSRPGPFRLRPWRSGSSHRGER
jgi:hypothetical protein